MLHELLFALSGHTGGLITAAASPTSHRLEAALDDAFPFAHPTERDLARSFLPVVSAYLRIAAFADRYRSTVVTHDADRFLLVDRPLFLEQQSAPEFALVPITVAPPPRGPFASGLYLRALCGGLSEVLDEYCERLVEIEAAALEDPQYPLARLQSDVAPYDVVLAALQDTVDEIESRALIGGNLLSALYKRSQSGIPAVRAAVLRLLAHCHRVWYNQITAWCVHGLLTDVRQEFFVCDTEARAENPADPAVRRDTAWVSRFSLWPDMLPSYVPLRVADRIFFVGKAVQVLRRRQQLDSADLAQFVQQLRQLAAAPAFSLVAFEQTVDSIRSRVASLLWELVVVKSSLETHIQSLKDYFLLGKGDFYHCFISDAQDLLSMPGAMINKHDVQGVFAAAAQKSSADLDPMLARFRVQLAGDSTDAWKRVRLTCAPEWPLDMIVSGTTLDRYGDLFVFLLTIKRVQLQLEGCWVRLMGELRALPPRERALLADLWVLRSRMGFLVDCLQYYIHVDVVEAQYALMQKRIRESTDFEAVHVAHQNFVAAVTNQCFLNVKPVIHALEEVFALCFRFAALLGEWDGPAAGRPAADRVVEKAEAIAKAFARQGAFLFTILSGVRSHQRSPQLAQLLLRVDFNRFFSVSSVVKG